MTWPRSSVAHGVELDGSDTWRASSEGGGRDYSMGGFALFKSRRSSRMNTMLAWASELLTAPFCHCPQLRANRLLRQQLGQAVRQRQNLVVHPALQIVVGQCVDEVR